MNTNTPTRIVGSNFTIKPSEVTAVLQKKDTRLAVEQILSLLNHKNQPNSIGCLSDRFSPKSFIDSPKTALDTLDILFQWHEDIFNEEDVNKSKKLVLWIMALLSEFYWNLDLYNPSIARDPIEQGYLHEAQQKLTDTFHFIVWNMIDFNFETNPQFWDVTLSHIIQEEDVLKKIESSSDFPNIRRILRTFQNLKYSEDDTLKKAA